MLNYKRIIAENKLTKCQNLITYFCLVLVRPKEDIMKFGEIVAPTMKELFIQRIEDFILSGELRPGDRLPSERELADEMKISKTVVHEGIRELVRCGFLDVVPRRGVTVADYSNSGNLNTLLAIMKRNGRAMDPRTACSLLDLRCYLECPAMKILAAHHTEKDIEALNACRRQAELASEGKSSLSFSEALYHYHRTVMRLSGNTITPLVTNALVPSVLPFWSDYEELEGEKAALDRLDLFTKYIEAGNGEEAAALLREGIEKYKRIRGYAEKK